MPSAQTFRRPVAAVFKAVPKNRIKSRFKATPAARPQTRSQPQRRSSGRAQTQAGGIPAHRRPIPYLRRQTEIRTFIALCLGLMGPDDREIAGWTGLSAGTIKRLRGGQFTPAIRTNTYLSIARAAGLQLHWQGDRATMQKINEMGLN